MSVTEVRNNVDEAHLCRPRCKAASGLIASSSHVGDWMTPFFWSYEKERFVESVFAHADVYEDLHQFCPQDEVEGHVESTSFRSFSKLLESLYQRWINHHRKK